MYIALNIEKGVFLNTFIIIIFCLVYKYAFYIMYCDACLAF